MPAKKTTSSKSTASKRKRATTKKSTATKKGASTKSRAAATKGKSTRKAKPKAGDREVTIDRRRKADRRDEKTAAEPKQPQLERREKVQRRRQIDPTTCERDYSDAEVEFMNAMDEYKRTSGRMFPTCSEVLEVIRNLGYVQLTPAEIATIRPEPVESAESTPVTDDVSEELEDAELTAAGAIC